MISHSEFAVAALLALSGWVGLVEAAPGDTQFISPGETPPTISADGGFVAFPWDGQLDPRGYFSAWDIYLTERATGVTQRISTDATNWEPDDDTYLGRNAALSADGRYVAYMSQKEGANYTMQYKVLVHDRQAGVTEIIATFQGPSPDENFFPSTFKVSISGDGRFVTFDALRADLVPGDTNGALDVYVYNRETKVLRRVSVASDGGQGNGSSTLPRISSNGRYVAFWSSATNLVPGDTNDAPDVFLFDRWNGTTERVSISSTGAQSHGGGSNQPALSAGARYVAFVSDAPDLVAGDTNGNPDVFVRDRDAGTTERIDAGPSGAGIGIEGGVSLSADGRYVAFSSRSSNLVPGDANTVGGTGASDVFVHDRATGEVEIASVRQNGLQLPISGAPSLSADGRTVAFFSYERDSGRRNESIYVHELGGTQIWGYRMIGGSNFGAQTIGTTSPARTYVVENTGAVALPIERVELRGTDAAQFRLDNRCGTTLAVGAHCNVRVSFAPQTVGAKAAQLAVVFTLREGNGVLTKSLYGTGVTASFSLQPATLGFGSLAVGTTSAAKLAMVTNTGESVLPISSVKLGGTNPGQFMLSHDCPAQVAKGASCTARVSFKPTSTGAKSAALIVTPAGGATAKSVALTGTGT